MKKILVKTLLMLLPVAIQAQNLVPNSSFESYDNCPTAHGQIPYTLVPFPSPPTVNDWFSAVVNSPDYFNECTNNIWIDVPKNYYGNYPARTGNGYAAIILFSGSTIGGTVSNNEYIECKLTTPLEAGETYTVSCYVKILLAHEPTMVGAFSADRISFSFTDTFLSSFTSPLYNTNAVPMYSIGKKMLDDSTQWTRISNAYVAKGGEQYLTLGYFNSGSNTNFKQIYPDAPNPITSANSYYAIEDVSVTKRPPCDTITYVFNTTICDPEDITQVLNSTATASGYNYIWSTGATTLSVNTNTTGSFWCVATRDCDIITDSFNIQPITDTVKKINNIAPCKIDTLELNSRENAISHIWSTGDTTQKIDITSPGSFSCISIKDCKAYVDIFDIKLKEAEIALNPITDTILCEGVLHNIGKEYDNVSYQWNTGDTTCCITPNSTGEYIITVTSDCDIAHDTVYIKFENCDNCLFVPTAFSPNGDGLNDTYGIKSSCNIDRFQIRIYNRWGQIVFESEDINDRWNGLLRADFAEQGTYFYYIEYTTPKDSEVITLKGDVSLIR